MSEQIINSIAISRREQSAAYSLVFEREIAPAKAGWDACVNFAHGLTLHCSKLDGENVWVVDALIPAGTSMPAFMHGWGSRCTRLHFANEQTSLSLDAAAESGEAVYVPAGQSVSDR